MSTASIEQWYTELIFKRLDLLGDCGLREQQFLCGPAEIQMLCDSPEYSNAEILYHAPFISCFLSNSNQVGTCLMTTALDAKTGLSLRRLRAGDGV
jgi:hypothetical protein